MYSRNFTRSSLVVSLPILSWFQSFFAACLRFLACWRCSSSSSSSFFFSFFEAGSQDCRDESPCLVEVKQSSTMRLAQIMHALYTLHT